MLPWLTASLLFLLAFPTIALGGKRNFPNEKGGAQPLNNEVRQMMLGLSFQNTAAAVLITHKSCSCQPCAREIRELKSLQIIRNLKLCKYHGALTHLETNS